MHYDDDDMRHDGEMVMEMEALTSDAFLTNSQHAKSIALMAKLFCKSRLW